MSQVRSYDKLPIRLVSYFIVVPYRRIATFAGDHHCLATKPQNNGWSSVNDWPKWRMTCHVPVSPVITSPSLQFGKDVHLAEDLRPVA